MNPETYEFGGAFLRTHRFVISRGVRHADGLRVLLKESLGTPTSRYDILRRELELLQQLPRKAVPRAIEAVRQSGREFLVLEDGGLIPLSIRLQSGPVTVDEFFELALGSCEALAELHARDFVFGSVNPQSILIGSGTGEVRLLDLSLAQRVPVDMRAMAAQLITPGSVQYIAPEQTGRLSRRTAC